MHKPYQTVHVFSPKSEKHEAFFLLFVCPHGFLQYSLLCLLSVACESLILYSTFANGEVIEVQSFTFPKIFLSRGLPSLWLRRRGWLADSRAG